MGWQESHVQHVKNQIFISTSTIGLDREDKAPYSLGDESQSRV